MGKRIAALLLIVSAVLMADRCQAHDDLPYLGEAPTTTAWTSGQKALAATAVALLATDYAQTRDIKNYSDAHERNPILGRHPSDGRIAVYFVTATAGILTAAHMMPEYRTTILGAVIAVEAVVILQNHQLGLRIKF